MKQTANESLTSPMCGPREGLPATDPQPSLTLRRLAPFHPAKSRRIRAKFETRPRATEIEIWVDEHPRKKSLRNAKIVVEQNRNPIPLTDDLLLIDSGVDSLGFAILVARLEDELGTDPFSIAENIGFPVTPGDFIKIYEQAASASMSDQSADAMLLGRKQ